MGLDYWMGAVPRLRGPDRGLQAGLFTAQNTGRASLDGFLQTPRTGGTAHGTLSH